MNDGYLDAMSTRGRSTEQKHAAEADLAFRVAARRNRLLGEWAAGVMGLSADQVTEYVGDVIGADLQSPGPEDVIAKVHGDLQQDGATFSLADIRSKVEELETVARTQLTAVDL